MAADAPATQACLLLVLALCVGYVAARTNSIRKRKTLLPLPPRPPGAWLLGNIDYLPERKPWLMYTELGKAYGARRAALLALRRRVQGRSCTCASCTRT